MWGRTGWTRLGRYCPSLHCTYLLFLPHLSYTHVFPPRPQIFEIQSPDVDRWRRELLVHRAVSGSRQINPCSKKHMLSDQLRGKRGGSGKQSRHDSVLFLLPAMWKEPIFLSSSAS